MSDFPQSPATGGSAPNMASTPSESSENRRDKGAADNRHACQAFLVVHEKTHEMRVLYVSSNIRNITKYEPSDIIGKSSLGFMSQSTVNFYQSSFDNAQQDELVVSHICAQDRYANPVYLRVMHFNCDNLGFNVIVTRPNPAGLMMEDELLGCQHKLGRRQNRGMAVHGCLVLENRVVDLNGSTGPLILFASRSLGRMLDMDTCDIQGSNFLSLVAPGDVLRASTFIEQITNTLDVVVERLRMREGQGGEIQVEIMAAGSDDGAMLLFQSEPRSGDRVSSMGEDREYMSLEEMLSSDYESSDINEAWRQLI